MVFNNWGVALKSLNEHLRDGVQDVYKEHFGTSQYFKVLIPRVHDSFVAWCRMHAIQDPARMRIELTEHVNMYPQFRTSNIMYLVEHLPDKYNVRGVWTV